MNPRTPILVAVLLACLLGGGLVAAQDGAPPAEPPASVAADAASAAGTWRGAIEIPGMPLEVSVTLRQEAGAWSGTIDIPAQGAAGLPLEDVRVDGDATTFAIADTPGEPTFEGTVAGDALTGTFSQSGGSFPFALEREGDGSAADAPASDGAPGDGAAGEAPAADAPAGDAAGAPAAPDAPAGPDVGPETASAYEDPQGRFSLPLPTGWTATPEGEDHVVVAGPEDAIRVHVVVSEGEDLEAAVRDAWATAVPSFDLEPDQTLEPPSEEGVERTIVVNYDPEDDTQVFQAVAQLHEGTIYTLLVDAELAALQRRAAQLQIATSGFEIAAVEDVDLSGQEPGEVADVVGELEPFIASTLDAYGLPGAAIAIVQDGEVAYAQGFGTTEAGGDEPVTPSTQMMIGSTGKTMTSMLVATLVDDGIVEWDTPAAHVLPEFAVADPELSESITLRDLLCACTGVPRRDFELFFNADELDAEAIVRSLRTFEFFTAFGEAFQYSNQLVATAGYAAAAADGAPFGELMEGYVASLHERVLDPIGLDDTTLSFDEVRERGEYAVPHQQNIVTGAYEPIDLAYEEILLPVAPAGAHWSTAADMARYMITELNEGVTPDGERVVSEANLRETWEPQVPVSATESYGLGWLTGEWQGLEWRYHSGNTLGFTSEFTFVPEAGVGIVVLTNAQGANAFAGAVAIRLFELLYDRPAESVAQTEFLVEQNETALAEAREQLQDRVDADAVRPWLGTWRHEALGEITLAMEGDQLVLDAGEFRTEVRPALDRSGDFDTYVTFGVPVTGVPLDLTTDEAGEEVVVLGQGAISYEFERAEGAQGGSESP